MSDVTEVAALEGAGNYTLPRDSAQLIRISPNLMAGAEIKETVEGPGELTAINRVGMWMPGQTGPAMGVDGREYVIRPTDAGTIVVTLDITLPVGESETQQYVIRIQ